MNDDKKLKKGDVVTHGKAKYRVTDPAGFAGTLPTAVIANEPNKGVPVILTGPRFNVTR